MTTWDKSSSTVHRFTETNDSGVERVIELEDFNTGGVAVRAVDPENPDTAITREFDELHDAVVYIKKRWSIDETVLPDTPTVEAPRLVLSLLADYVGSDIAFGHEVPAETRDAVQAAYETLDEPGLPMSFHDCPDDGTPLEPVHDADDAQNEQRLECPTCGTEYVLDRDQGILDPA